MNNRLFRYLKNKQNTRRIKPLTIDEAHEIANEIERLNNIINELKKWLEYEIYCDFSNEMTKAYQDSLDKLKELKENK